MDLRRPATPSEDTAKDAGKAIEGTANKAVDEIERIAKEAEKFGMSAFDDIKNLANRAKKRNRGRREFGEARDRECSQSGEEGGRGLRQPGEGRDRAHRERCCRQGRERREGNRADVREAHPRARHRAASRTRSRGIMVDLSKDLGKPGFAAVAKAAHGMNKGLTNFSKSNPSLTDELDAQALECSFKIGVVLVGLSINRMYTRGAQVAGMFDRLANEGLNPRRRDIRAVLDAVLPSSAGVGIGAEFSWGITFGAGGQGRVHRAARGRVGGFHAQRARRAGVVAQGMTHGISLPTGDNPLDDLQCVRRLDVSAVLACI